MIPFTDSERNLNPAIRNANIHTPRPICPKGHTPSVFYVPLYAMIDGKLLPLEYMVQMTPDGQVTNLYDDGTAGVTPEDRSEAEEQETVFCGECLSDCNWNHGA